MEAKEFFDYVPLIPRVTSVKDYTPYRHVRLFLQTRYKALPVDRKGLPVNLPEMMESIGYRKRLKFLNRMREQWLNAEGKIPLKFLDFLNVTKEDLLSVIEFDKEDFYEALKYANRPRYFQFRVLAAVYPVKRLPENVTEQEAVLIAADFLKTQPDYIQKSGAWINYGGIKTLFINADGSTSVSYYAPAILFESGYVIFEAETMPGTVRLR